MSLDPLHQLQFILHTDPAHFQKKLEDMLAGINNRLPETAAPPFIQKLKWVLTELITNAYKHSGQPEVLLRVQFHGYGLHIIKEDKGAPLNFCLPGGETICWPVTDSYYNSEINVFHDELNVLNACIDDTGSVVFSLKQKTAPGTDALREMNEHFGLIIIARVCESFSYTFEAETGRNIFTSVLKY